MRIRLNITPSDQKSSCLIREGAEVRIGRDPKCEVSLEGDQYQGVSWLHALIELKPTGAFVSDCSSTNGTYLNNRRLESRAVLRAGDVIRFGQTGPEATLLDIDLRCSPSIVPAEVQAAEVTQTGQVARTSRARLWVAVFGALAVLIFGVAVTAWFSRSQSSGGSGRGEESVARDSGGDSKTTTGQARTAPSAPTLSAPTDGSVRGGETKTPSGTGVTSELARTTTTEKHVVFDPEPWRIADFVLINPGEFAVGVKSHGSDAFKVNARAEGRSAQLAVEAAWRAGVRVIGDNPALTREIHAACNPGDIPRDDIIKRIMTLLYQKPILNGVNGKLKVITFNDLRERRLRLGYLFGQGKDAELYDLRTGDAEPYQEAFTQPGSRRELSDYQLRQTGDFLDYCMFKIIAELAREQIAPDRKVGEGGNTGLRIRVALAVDPNSGGLPSPQPEPSANQLERAPPGPPKGLLEFVWRLDEWGDRLRRARHPVTEELAPSKAPRTDPRLPGANAVAYEAVGLAGEIRSRLAAWKVPPVEWLYFASKDVKLKELPFEEIGGKRLSSVSHMVVFRIRPPRERGRYELSMRLVCVQGNKQGEILWEDQGDRIQPGEEVIDLAASPYLLNTGRLSLIALGESKGRSRNAYPLQLPLLSEKFDPEPRLVYIESEEQETVRFRDLFSRRLQSVRRNSVTSSIPVTSVSDVPAPHQMRYCVWRLAKAILPLAGRVNKLRDNVTAQLNLSRKDGIRPGDRLAVIRSDGATGDAETTLAAELIVREASDSGSNAVFDPPAKDQAVAGDIVYRKPPRRLVAAFLDLQPDLVTGPRIPGNRLGSNANDLLTMTRDVGKRLLELLQAGLIELRLPVVDRDNLHRVLEEQRLENIDPNTAAKLGKLTGATHIVLGRISPGRDQASVSLRVLEVDSGLIVEQLQFNFTRNDMESWKP